jgi:hypothetical protein
MADMIGTLKTAYELVKDLVNLRDAVASQGKVAELQRQILNALESAIDANQERVTLMETISELRGKIAQLEAWNTEKDRYKKVEVAPGMIAYTLKEGMEGGEPAHYACTDCYSDNKISILKRETWDPGDCKVLSCHRCGSVLYLVGEHRPEHQKLRKPSR